MSQLVIILGPTGTGKSQMAVDKAVAMGGEIINADSRQVYRELKIGSAIPSDDLLKKVPHHLLAHLQLDEPWNAGIFEREASALIEQIIARGKIPIVVGGTGLYIRSLLYGLCQVPAADTQLRQEMDRKVEQGGLPELYEKLCQVDAAAASKIHPHNRHRVIRALEIFHLTGKTFSQLQAEQPFSSPRYDAQIIGLTMDRDQLYARLDLRVMQMIESGLQQEATELFKQYGPQSILSKAIGYAEWSDYFDGVKSLEEVIAAIQQNTRRYAKRQMTWFGKERNIQWISVE